MREPKFKKGDKIKFNELGKSQEWCKKEWHDEVYEVDQIVHYRDDDRYSYYHGPTHCGEQFWELVEPVYTENDILPQVINL